MCALDMKYIGYMAWDGMGWGGEGIVGWYRGGK